MHHSSDGNILFWETIFLISILTSVSIKFCILKLVIVIFCGSEHYEIGRNK